MDRGAWQATVHGVAKSWAPLRTSLTQNIKDYTCKMMFCTIVLKKERARVADLVGVKDT